VRKLLLAIVALALAAGFGYTLGRRTPEPVIGTAWAQRFVTQSPVAGKVMIGDVVLEGVVGVTGLEDSCAVVEVRDPVTGELKSAPGPLSVQNLTISLLANKSSPDLMLSWFEDSVVNGRLEKKSGAVIIYDPETEEDLLRYQFFEGWPCKWIVPDFSSRSTGMAIEKIEIAVEKVERVR